MIKTIAIGIAALLALGAGGILTLAAGKPDTFSIKRSIAVKASPEKVFALINDFDHWGGWSPYEKKDPAMKRTRSGPARGAGAVYAWEGDSTIGVGRMTIAESVAPSRVRINLDFEKPMKANNVVTFTLTPGSDGTTVTWDMQGPTPFLGKIIHVLIDMDKMVGTDFETGLVSLKALAEQNILARN